MQTIFGEGLNFLNLFRTGKYKHDFRKQFPDYFDYDGILVFTGKQGSGKTLSAVSHIQTVVKYYSNCKVISNIHLKNVDYVKMNGLEELPSLISEHKNGYNGVLVFIDEFQNELDCTESKNISIGLLTEITQLRKQRIHIVCTSQVFTRLVKPVRQQFKQIVQCNCYFGMIQINHYCASEDCEEVGGKLVMNNSATSMWFHKPHNYESYDTFEKVNRSMRKERVTKYSDDIGGNYGVTTGAN